MESTLVKWFCSILLFLCVSVIAQVPPPYIRNAWDTNDGPAVTNLTLSLATNAIQVLQQTNWPLSSITNAQNLTNWALLSTNVLADIDQTNWPLSSITNAGNLAYSNSIKVANITDAGTAAYSNAYSFASTNSLIDPGVSYADTPNIDAFSRLRVSAPVTLFEVQSQYGSNPLKMDQIATGAGIAPSWSTNSRMVMLQVNSGGSGGRSALQSFAYTPYQPGKSQLIFITGVLGTNVTGAVKRFGYGDTNNGVFYEQNGSTLQITLRSSTSGSVNDNTIAQSSWNIDHFDGTGPSGVTLVPTNCFILVIDLQFLAMGRVRVGFDVGGVIKYAHQFLNANVLQAPYMQTATLPVMAELRAGAALAVNSTTFFKCAMVCSEGGFEIDLGRDFSTEGTVTAGSGTRTHAVSVRPATTFFGCVNRGSFDLDGIDILAGANPVFYEIVVGATFNVDPTWAMVNTNYSFMQVGTGGVFSNLTSGIVISAGYVGSGASAHGAIAKDLSISYPITLDSAGSQRPFGTLSVLLTGISGTSASRVSLNWKEIR